MKRISNQGPKTETTDRFPVKRERTTRPAKVALGKKLVADPSYPSVRIVKSVANLLARKLTP